MKQITMFKFHYYFLGTNNDWRDFELIKIDKDSAYISFSGDTDDVLKSSMRENITMNVRVNF